MNLSSSEFLQKLKQRDKEVVAYLFNQYHEVLFKGAIKQKLSTDQAEAVVADTWSSFFEKTENFKGNSHIRTYLFGIMYNKVKELWRSNKKYTDDYQEYEIDQMFLEDGSHKSTPQDPSNWVQSHQTLELIQHAIENLPVNQRLAFTLKEVEGESTEDICNILGVSSTNLGVLIYRAKNNLRIALEEYYKDGGKQ